MLKEYKTLLSYGKSEVVIERSKFIGHATPVESEEEAVAFIEKIKTEYWNATHNVPAYMVGENNEIQRYSDDKEPSGTAGVPVLEVIKREDLKNVAVVVTRYFVGHYQRAIWWRRWNDSRSSAYIHFRNQST
jgi:uncharacterized YigZ family protein